MNTTLNLTPATCHLDVWAAMDAHFDEPALYESAAARQAQRVQARLPTPPAEPQTTRTIELIEAR